MILYSAKSVVRKDNDCIDIDRLEKHGQLAPLKEISKRLTEEDLKPDPEQNKTINDINYYNLNDSFIDDEDAYVIYNHIYLLYYV